jgi:predicted ATPase/class 3 adenylate cyclase/Tfp pilus assembly protein PilF
MVDTTPFSPSSLPTGTLTFLFTDVEESTRLWESQPEAMRTAMARHDELIESCVAQSGGVVVRPRGEGDSRFAVFQNATDATVAAIAIQRKFFTETWALPYPIRVRMALHTGEADLRDGDYYGTAVNRCARLRSVAHGGQTLISQTTQLLVSEALSDGTDLLDLGEHQLKDLKRSEHIYQLVIEGLPADFPPLKTPDSLLTNLPVPRNPLIGRDHLLEMISDLLLRQDVALVTLTGAGGTGKSRLGIQVALDLNEHFADGVYLVVLEAIQDPQLVIPTIARTLGLSERAGGPSLAEMLKDHLCNRQMLLLLDNFEQVLPAAPQIADLLENCRRIKILVTSRAPLHLRAEKVIPVPPLELPPLKEALDLQPLSQYSAVQLFIQRAQSVRPDFKVTNENAPAVAEICHQLDGLPLAIELASARTKMLSPRALLARLGHRFVVLRGGTRDLPERQHTLFSAIDWSYNLLDESQKRMLRRLSVFAGGWTFEAAEAICNAEGEEPIEVFEGLDILMDNNLLKPPEEQYGEPRLRMLETIREFAHEQLIDSGEAESAHQRHTQYYLSLVERVDTEMQHSAMLVRLRQLEAELDNFRAAMSWSLEQGQTECALRIAMALWHCWETLGLWCEGLQWLERGLAGKGSIPDKVRAKALTRTGWLIRCMGDYTRAIPILQESLALSRKINDQASVARALANLSALVMRQGDYARATAMLEESLELQRHLGYQHGICAVLVNLGYSESEQGHHQRAIELFTEALALARTLGDDDYVGWILNNMGEVYAHQDDYNRAEAYYAEGEPIFQRLGNRTGVAYISGNRGVVAFKQGDFTRAFDLLATTINNLQELGQKEYTILFVERLAVIAKEMRHPERAARLLSASESLYKAIGVARPPVDKIEYEACLRAVRSQLGEAAFAAAWSEGSTMSFEQVVAYALDKSN